jgi:multidrug resistance protein, MATE family
MSTAFTLPQRLRASFGDADYRRVLNLALPAVGEQMLNMTVGLADTFMVGHLGAAAVAAVGLSNQAVMLVTTFFAAVATGVTALVARHIGAQERDHANTIMHQGYLLSIFFGVLTAAFGLLLSFETMRALRAPADVIGPGTTYLSIVALTFPLAACLFVGNAALRGSGDTRTPMLVMLAVNVVNIGVAYAAIYGLGPIPALGVTGSAIGAATARGAGGLIVTALLFRGRSGLRLRLRRFKPDLVQIKRIANIGLPAGAETLLMRLAQTMFAVTIASLGTLAYAAHQIALQAESISYMPGFGFAIAATTLVGQGLGAHDPRRARADGRLAQWMAVGVMSCMGVIFFIFPAQIIGIFINDPAVIALGVWPLRLVAFSQPMLAVSMVLSGALRGAGDTRTTLLITGGSLWLVRIPLALLLAPRYGLVGAWIAMSVDLNVRGTLAWLRFRGDRWTKLKV